MALQRRADLIPNLVRTVERYADQERDVLTEVTQARANASSIQLNANDANVGKQAARAAIPTSATPPAGSVPVREASTASPTKPSRSAP